MSLVGETRRKREAYCKILAAAENQEIRVINEHTIIFDAEREHEEILF